MKKVIKLSLIALTASLVVGCASTSDIENLQSQIDGLKTSVAQASADAANAQSAAADAAAKAAAAEFAVCILCVLSSTVCSRLDNLFKKSQLK